LPATLDLAKVLDHTVHDCAYLALALHLDARYVTADQQFWRKTQGRPELADRCCASRISRSGAEHPSGGESCQPCAVGRAER
jgi:hypothetical protein